MIEAAIEGQINERKQMLAFYAKHSMGETTEYFGVSSQTIRKWNRRYAGTDESLIDKRHDLNRITRLSLSDEEKWLSKKHW